MIYYDIQHYKSLDDLSNLLPLLAHEHNSVHVSYDSSDKQADEIKWQAISNTYKDHFAQLDFSFSSALSWGGFSITQTMFAALQKALLSPNWQYFVNLSGTCLPLKTQAEIFACLTDQKQLGFESFCYSFDVKKTFEWFSSELSEPLDNELKKTRVTFKFGNKFKPIVENANFNPAQNVQHRIGAYFAEKEKNSFEVRPLTFDELQKRHAFFIEAGFKVGRQWVILSREQVEWIVTSSFSKELLALLEGTFISDEMFFQNLLFSAHNPLRNKLLNSNLRFQQGRVTNMDYETFQLASATPSLFARKVVPADVHKIMQDLQCLKN